MIHELKIWPVYFEAVLNGTKTFEIRKNDREFSIGDTLILKEYEPGEVDYSVVPEVIKESGYTGKVIKKEISYLFKGGIPRCGLRKGHVILGLEQECIQLRNIDLTGWNGEMQLDKINEEFKEFGESTAEYLLLNTQKSKEHAIEEYFDLIQASLGLLAIVGISAEEVMKEYPKHLEKLQNRPRKED